MSALLAPPPPTPERPADPRALARLAAAHGLIVSGARPPLPAYLRQVWARRHFVAVLAAARLRAPYSDSRLGQLWQMATPLLNAGVYYLVFGLLLGAGHGTAHYIPYLCTGVVVFTFTQSAVLTGTRSVGDSLALTRALRFPRACLPLAATLVQFRQLLYAIGVLAAVLPLSGVPVTPRWLLLAPALLLQAVFNAGLALAVARVGATYTDTAQVTPFLMRGWTYFSGVFYNLGVFTARAPGWLARLLEANPGLLYPALARYALIDTVTPAALPPHVWPLALLWALAAAAGGLVYFWAAEESYGRD